MDFLFRGRKPGQLLCHNKGESPDFQEAVRGYGDFHHGDPVLYQSVPDPVDCKGRFDPINS